MAYETALIRKVKEHVGLFIAEHFTEKICYHNIDHTLDVVEASEMIGRACGLNDAELELVIIAAWFHDTGYYLGNENHESESARIARDFLRKQNISDKKIATIAHCIHATKIPQNPKSLLEEVLCDADLFHLATDHFFTKSELLRQELTWCNGYMSNKRWMDLSSKFIECHHYHTDYAQKNLCPLKEANHKRLIKKIKEKK
jgi:predicted metal-dependent HD superfamily phosphohydrolase